MEGLWKVLFGLCLLCSVFLDKTNGEDTSTVAAVTTAAAAAKEESTAAETTEPSAPRPTRSAIDFGGHNFTVATKEDAVYYQRGPNNTYEGFVVDLFESLGKLGNFTTHYVTENNIGAKDYKTNKWNGVLGRVQDDKDENTIAAGPVTKTEFRGQDFGFTESVERFSAALIMQKRHQSEEVNIQNLEDLLSQTTLKYGVAKGALETYFRESDDPLIKKMWENIQKEKTLEKNNNDGVSHARSDKNYAFILESNFAKAQILSKPCELEMINLGFYGRYYALGLKKNSPHIEKLNDLLMAMDANGEMYQLKAKWFGKNQCSGKSALVYNLLLLLSVITMGVVFH